MTAFLCILAAFVLILLIPVRVAVRTGPPFTVAVRYLFWGRDVVPAPPKEPKEPKPAKPLKKKKAPAIEQLKKYEPLVYDVLPRCVKPVRRLLRRTTIAEFELAIAVVGRDAADTALAFGRMNAAIYTAIAAVDRIFTLRVQRVDITPDFTAEKGQYFFSGEIRLIPLAALIAAGNIGVLLLFSAVKTAVGRRKNKTDSEREVAHGK